MPAIHKLSAAAVREAKPAEGDDGKLYRNILGDGGGLRLVVEPDGHKTWDFRYKSPVTGKERYMGLGSNNGVTLAQARAKAKAAREQVAAGIDPLDARKEQKAAKVAAEEAADEAASVVAKVTARIAGKPIVTFEDYARDWIATHEAGWKNPVHKAQWSQTMKDYAYPVLGKMDIAGIETEHVLNVLRPIWNEIPETARRVRGRMQKILSAAKAEKLRSGENPAAWTDHLDHILPKRPKGGHHAALPYEDAPRFWKSLRQDTSAKAQALQFIMLTAVRFNVAVPAMSSEINFDKAVWDIPQDRMKMDEENYQVPLVDVAMELIRGREGLLFPSPNKGVVLSSTALLSVGKQHANGVPVTTHGWRSTFRDWIGDETETSWEVGEASLSHKVENETQAAYRRKSALEKRRKVFQAWYDYLEGGTSEENATQSTQDRLREAEKRRDNLLDLYADNPSEALKQRYKEAERVVADLAAELNDTGGQHG